MRSKVKYESEFTLLAATEQKGTHRGLRQYCKQQTLLKPHIYAGALLEQRPDEK